MIITFAGHADTVITTALIAQIKTTIEPYLKSNQAALYFGGYGTFDLACASAAKDLKAVYSFKSCLITPYLNSKRFTLESGLYDEIIYPSLEKVPLKFAISKRNEFMISSCDLLVAYISRQFGGAYNSLVSARNKSKQIINLAECL